MGCPSSKERQIHSLDRQSEIITLLKRLQLLFKQQSYSLQSKITQQRQQLNIELNKPSLNRSRVMQYNLMQQITLHKHFKMIYDYLSMQCKMALDRQGYFPLLFNQNLPNQFQANNKESIRKPIEILLFSISIINDGKNTLKNEDVVHFQKISRTKFKDVHQPKSVEHQLLAYYKLYPIPNPEMIRELAFQICSEENISISKFQEVGHEFRY